MRNYMLCFLMIVVLSSCSFGPIARMTSSDMNKLELGMSKEQVTAILGKGYTIAEKRIENGNQIEVLSYRDFYRDDELYMFLFIDDKLEKWYRELMPRYGPVTENFQY